MALRIASGSSDSRMPPGSISSIARQALLYVLLAPLLDMKA